MNPESGLQCDLFVLYGGTQSWTYNLYCHGRGRFFTPAKKGMF